MNAQKQTIRALRRALPTAAFVLAALALLSSLAAPASALDTGPIQWPNQSPRGNPFPRSQRFSGVTFPGPYANYTNADTWYPSWGADGKLYSPYMDGQCEQNIAVGSSNLGTAVISGDDPLNLSLSCSTIPEQHTGYDGRYASASLSYRGVWYLGSYLLNMASPPGAAACGNYCTLGPFVGFDTSADGGQTWTFSSHTPEHPLFGESIAGGHRVRLGALHVVDFGRDMEHSPDGYMYLVGHGGGGPTSQDSWIGGDSVYLVRVKPSPQTVNEASAYEFYAGRAGGTPRWSHSFSALQPLISWPGHLGNATIDYDAPLHTYLMWMNTPSDGVNGQGPYDMILLESSSITGPWRTVQYFPHFGDEAYFANTPTKFMSADGRTMWLSYSANYAYIFYGMPTKYVTNQNPMGSTYSWVLRQMRLNVIPGGGQPPPAPREAPGRPPAQRRCPSQRTLTLRLPAGLHVRRVTATLEGRRLRVHRGGRRVVVSIARGTSADPRQRVRVRIVLRGGRVRVLMLAAPSCGRSGIR